MCNWRRVNAAVVVPFFLFSHDAPKQVRAIRVWLCNIHFLSAFIVERNHDTVGASRGLSTAK